MSRLTYRTLREEVEDEIRKKIIRQELKSGERIVEQNLSDEFHTSRGPVREALRQLEKEGLVEYVRNSGCRVKAISVQEAYEIYLMRANYELLAIKLMDGKVPDSALEEMEHIIHTMREFQEQDFEKIFDYDNHFHRCLIRMTRLPRLLKAWDELSYGNIVSGNSLIRDKKVTVKRQAEIHQEIFDICKEGKIENICKVISEHYMRTIRRLMEEEVREQDFSFSLEYLI